MQPPAQPPVVGSTPPVKGPIVNEVAAKPVSIRSPVGGECPYDDMVVGGRTQSSNAKVYIQFGYPRGDGTFEWRPATPFETTATNYQWSHTVSPPDPDPAAIRAYTDVLNPDTSQDIVTFAEECALATVAQKQARKGRYERTPAAHLGHRPDVVFTLECPWGHAPAACDRSVVIVTLVEPPGRIPVPWVYPELFVPNPGATQSVKFVGVVPGQYLAKFVFIDGYYGKVTVRTRLHQEPA